MNLAKHKAYKNLDRELWKLIKEGFDIGNNYYEGKLTLSEVKMIAKKTKQVNTLKDYIKQARKEYQKKRYDSAIRILEKGFKDSERFDFPKWHKRFLKIIQNIQQKQHETKEE